MSDAIINHYTKLELQRHNNISKQLVKILKRQSKLTKGLEELEKQETTLNYNLRQIENNVEKRKARKCKHNDIYGPYECSRDDCSGGHHRCQNCGNQVDDASPELLKKTGKKWIAWNEKY